MFACRKKAEKDNKPKLKYDECDDKKKKKKRMCKGVMGWLL